MGARKCRGSNRLGVGRSEPTSGRFPVRGLPLKAPAGILSSGACREGLTRNHGGGGIRGPSGETESGSYAERERRAGLRRRRRHCRETPLPNNPPPQQSAQRRPREPRPTAKRVRGRAGASQERRPGWGIRLPSLRSGGIRRVGGLSGILMPY